MKLTRQAYLEDFEGKDIWVKCYHKREEYDMYIRVVRFLDSRTIDYTSIPAWFMDEHTLEMASMDDALEGMDEIYVARISDLDIIYPFEAYTTDEIRDEIIALGKHSPFDGWV